jgi:hypothetical protein
MQLKNHAPYAHILKISHTYYDFLGHDLKYLCSRSKLVDVCLMALGGKWAWTFQSSLIFFVF